MSWMSGLTGLAGAGLGAIGGFLQGRAGDIVRSRLENIANTPGVDIGAATGESLSNMDRYLPEATALSGSLSKANQANLLAEEEMALPGAGAARQKNLSAINNLFADDAEWLAGVQRRGAAMGVGRGLFGSGAAQVGTLRLSDQERNQRTQLGTGLLGSLLGSLRIANTPGVQAFLGPSPSETVSLRSGERTQRMNYLAQAAGVPGMTGAFGSYLSSVGGMLTGAGALGMMGGGGMGGGMGGMPAGAQYMSQAGQYDRLMQGTPHWGAMSGY